MKIFTLKILFKSFPTWPTKHCLDVKNNKIFFSFNIFSNIYVSDQLFYFVWAFICYADISAILTTLSAISLPNNNITKLNLWIGYNYINTTAYYAQFL